MLQTCVERSFAAGATERALQGTPGQAVDGSDQANTESGRRFSSKRDDGQHATLQLHKKGPQCSQLCTVQEVARVRSKGGWPHSFLRVSSALIDCRDVLRSVTTGCGSTLPGSPAEASENPSPKIVCH